MDINYTQAENIMKKQIALKSIKKFLLVNKNLLIIFNFAIPEQN